MKADKLAAIGKDNQFLLQSGTIESIGEFYRILADDRHHTAVRAFSCIIEPRAGDVVLFSIDERQQCHILSIIERPNCSDTELAFPGNVCLRTSRGELNIHSRRGMNMVCEQEITQVAETFTLAARKGLFKVDSLTAIGSTLVSRIKFVQTIADRLETVAEHWLQKLTNSFRQIDGVDQLKARDSIHTVKNLYSMRSKQAAILARKDIKMDAERIHMG